MLSTLITSSTLIISAVFSTSSKEEISPEIFIGEFLFLFFFFFFLFDDFVLL